MTTPLSQVMCDIGAAWSRPDALNLGFDTMPLRLKRLGVGQQSKQSCLQPLCPSLTDRRPICSLLTS